MESERLRPMPRRFLAAALAGGAFGVAVVVFVLAAAHMGPGARHFSDDFFDGQTRAWLAGRWDVPPQLAGIEGFATPTGTQIYFGIAPSLLRLPLFALTDRFDGRVTQISELAALVVLLTAAARLLWIARVRLAGDDDADPGGALGVIVPAAFVGLVGAGSTATVLATQSTVFGEAALWGLALAVASSDQLVRFLAAPTLRRAALAAAFGGAALNCRLTMGLGALLPVALVALAVALPETWRAGRLGALADRVVRVPPVRRSSAVAMGAVLLASVLVLVGSNKARFGQLWVKVPNDQQVVFKVDARRYENNLRSPGAFSLSYLPTDALAYLRPDGLLVRPAPAVSFPDLRGVPVLGAPLDLIEPTASLPSAMPGLFVLAVAGAFVWWRSRRTELRVFRLPVVGALVPALMVLTYTSLAHRYTADLLPLVLLLAAMGGGAALGLTSRAGRTVSAVALVAAVLWGAWVSIGLSMWLSENNSLRTRDALAGWATWTADVQDRLRPGAAVDTHEAPPPDPAGWDLAARPDCARVYVATLGGWYAFAWEPGTGVEHVRVQAPPPDGQRHALAESADGTIQLALRSDGGPVQLESTTDGGRTWKVASSTRRSTGAGPPPPLPLHVGEDGRIDLVIDTDWYLKALTVTGDDPDTSLLVREHLEGPERPVVADPAYPGGVLQVAPSPNPCLRWTATG